MKICDDEKNNCSLVMLAIAIVTHTACKMNKIASVESARMIAVIDETMHKIKTLQILERPEMSILDWWVFVSSRVGLCILHICMI